MSGDLRNLTPRQAERLLRREVAKAWPEITAAFIAAAKSGSPEHVKLATKLLQGKRRAGKQTGSRATLAPELVDQA